MPSILDKNLAVIPDADFCKLIREVPDFPEWASPITTNGTENFLVENGSAVAPAYIGDGDIHAAITEEIGRHPKEAWHKENVILLCGVGLGHTLEKLLKKKESTQVVILVEPSHELLRNAFSRYDFSKHLRQGTLLVIRNKEELTQAFSVLEQVRVTDAWYLFREPYTELRPLEYGGLFFYASSTINSIMCNTGTMLGAGAKISANDVDNLPYLIRHRGVEELKDVFKGKPAVVVSTGPSLAKNIHFLMDPKHRERVVVIAVFQALRILLAYGIRPDFVGTVDYGEVNMEHFKGLTDCGVPLVVLDKSYDGILKAWTGPKFVASQWTGAPEETSCRLMDGKGQLESGGSVSHFCLGLALQLGCNPIALIGQDLSYSAGALSHNPLADASGKIEVQKDGMILWNVDDPRSKLKDAAHAMGYSIQWPGYFGGFVPTNVGLASFISAFEGIADRWKDRTFFNATEGGVNMKGFQRIALESFLLEHGKKPKVAKVMEDFQGYAKDAEALARRAVDVLGKDVEKLRTLEEEGEKALKAARSALHAWGDKKKLMGLLKENEEHSLEAEKIAKMNPIIGASIYAASRRLFAREYSVKSAKVDDLLQNKTAFKKRIARNEQILQAAIKTAKELREEHYEPARDLLARYVETGDDLLLNPRLPAEAPDLEDAEAYFAKGNWAHPLLDADRILAGLPAPDLAEKALAIKTRALSMRGESIREAVENRVAPPKIIASGLLEEAREVGQKGEYRKALDMLEEANKKLPGELPILWGLATTCHIVGVETENGKLRDRSLKLYEQILRDHANDPGIDNYRFEYANVLIAAGRIQEGVRIFAQVTENTDRFDRMFAGIGRIFMQLRLWAEARDAFRTYLRLFPYAVGVMKDLAQCHRQLGEAEEGEEMEKRLKDLTSRWPG